MRKHLCLLALASLGVGCHLDKLLSGGSGGGGPSQGATGALQTAAATSGSNLPAGDYTLMLDSAPRATIGINDSITAAGLSAGNHRAALGGVPSNCSVSGDNPRTVPVQANDTVRTTFSVVCTPPATQLVFTIPPPLTVTMLKDTFQVELSAEDTSAQIVRGFTGRVRLAIGNDGSLGNHPTLRGTTEVDLVNGIATFRNLSIDQSGVNYTLKASVVGLPDAFSRPFNVIAVP